MIDNLFKKHRLQLIIAAVLTVVCAAVIVIYNQQAKTVGYGCLIGKWVRPNGGYILDIKSINRDGKIEMAYLNPRPINVSKAQANTKAGKIKLFIELRDKGYPGSYYTLTFDSETNRLVGVYHHLVLNQNFDIYFVKI